MVNGAFREPGEITICLIPLDLKYRTNVCAAGILEYIMEYKNTLENGIPPKSGAANYRMPNMVLLLFCVSIHSFNGLEAEVIPPPTKMEALSPLSSMHLRFTNSETSFGPKRLSSPKKPV